jgi:hypothetical protein
LPNVRPAIVDSVSPACTVTVWAQAACAIAGAGSAMLPNSTAIASTNPLVRLNMVSRLSAAALPAIPYTSAVALL